MGLPFFDPLAKVTTGIEGMESRERQHQASEELNPHLTRSMGIENKRGRENGTHTPFSNSSWKGRRLVEEGTIRTNS
jgi:hypothetical protein